VPQYYFSLDNGQEYTQSTYVTHSWVFFDASGQVVQEYVTKAGDTTIEIK
jgi:hypothetical protein